MQRFNHDADNQKELKNYIYNRALQLLGFNAFLKAYQPTDYGALVFWDYYGEEYTSVFLYPQARGQGMYLNIIQKNNYKILTVPDCDIEAFLKAKSVPHLVLNRFLETPEYKAISNYYGDKKAERSQVYLMNHIDEGLAILNWIKADELVKKAYCLHPILQSDKDLLNNFSQKDFLNFDPKAIILAMEYRHVANNYLSFRQIKTLEDIQLSPLSQVQEMLVADKIQNYKDFILYHQKTHPRSKQLEEYFNNWLKKLNIEDKFKEYVKKLDIPSF